MTGKDFDRRCIYLKIPLIKSSLFPEVKVFLKNLLPKGMSCGYGNGTVIISGPSDIGLDDYKHFFESIVHRLADVLELAEYIHIKIRGIEN